MDEIELQTMMGFSDDSSEILKQYDVFFAANKQCIIELSSVFCCCCYNRMKKLFN